jgi:hypothetical protein
MKRTINLNLTDPNRNAESVPGMVHPTFGFARRVFLVLALAMSMRADDQDNQSKYSSDLSTDPSAVVDVIVQFKTPPTRQELKDIGSYGQLKKQFDGIKAINVQLTRKKVNKLMNDPNVLYVSPNRPATGSLDIVDATVFATYAWQFAWDGTGIGVAVVDSGVTLKRDLMAPNGVNSRVV